MTADITIDTIRAAASAIANDIIRTPVVLSRTLSEITGAEIFLKLENLQYTASFKERGALNKLLSLTAAERVGGIIAMSAGNHAQAVAHHATRLGIDAKVVMPAFTPYTKVSNTERLGATVVLFGESLSEASDRAAEIAAEEGRCFIHPYDDPLVIAGQGTVGLEMLEEVPDLDVLVVPIGGGGLISGCAIAAKAMQPSIEIVGVEAELYPSMLQTLRGEAVAAAGPTIAEGIAVKRPGTLTRDIVRALVPDILLVGEGVIEQAVQMIAEIEKLVAEGAGAVALAAVMANPERFRGRRCGLVVSGGNIDMRVLASVLIRGLVRSGRLVRVRVAIDDRPGNLAKVATLIGELGGNIVEVEHERWFYDVPISMTEVDFMIEALDPENAQEIADGLSNAGFTARLLGATAR